MVLNPITPHGSVVVNAGYDYQHFSKASASGGGNVADHRIEKKDLVFCDKNLSKRKRSSYNEPDLHVLASTTGVADPKRDRYAFIGVSNTHLDADSHRHAAVTIAGLTTIQNTGVHRIEVGDKVVWDIADHSSRGANKRRKVFQTVPYREAFKEDSKSRFDAILAAIEAAGKGATPGGDLKTSTDAQVCAKVFLETKLEVETLKKMQTFLHCYAETRSQLNSRVVGTALSKAEEGQDFDILIRHSH